MERERDVTTPPPPPEDPYTPEPGPRVGERRAFRTLWWAWMALAVVVAVVLVAIFA
jgi:hypothetical protein